MTRKQIILGVMFGVVGLGIAFAAHWLEVPAQLKQLAGLNKSEGTTIDGVYATDLSSDRKLVGASHYIFVGKVLKETGSVSVAGGMPAAQFSVDVISNIKGQLHGEVVVNQWGGGLMEGGDVIVLPGAEYPKFGSNRRKTDGLLQVGATYLFATRYDLGQYNISAPEYDRQLITADASLGDDELLKLAENSERAKAFQAAYPNEILLDADLKHNATWNSYQSLQAGHLLTPPSLEPSGAVTPSVVPVSSPDASVSPSDASSASPVPTDAPLAS